MSEKIKFSIVMPAYLEEENLRLLLPRIKEAAKELKGAHEIIVVDTLSALDATESVCKQNEVRYVKRGPSNVFGDAVRTGIQAAQGEWILFMDSDGSHTPHYIPLLASHTGEYDIVIASRYIEGGLTENPQSLIWMSRLLNFSYSLILNLKCNDVSNSFKFYRASYLRELTLKADNFDIIEEILFKISRNHPDYKIKEIPFSFKKRMFGETKRNLMLFIFTYLFTMVRLRLSVTGKNAT